MIGSLALYTCVTILQVSYNSLGFELSRDYHERTNIFAYRSFFQQISTILVGYLFYFCTLDLFGDTMTGAKYVGIGVGLVIFLFVLPTVFACAKAARNKRPNKKKYPSCGRLKQP